jgi:CspA family cold shock protein
MNQGKIKKWNDDRGFGFIIPDDGGADIFFHVREIRSGRVNEGDRVQFDMGVSERNGRPMATRVTAKGHGVAHA